jgi:glycerol-3-phosphate O-acyltransferase
MVSSGLNMLHENVNLSSDNFVTLSTPDSLPNPGQTVRLSSMSEVLRDQVDSVCFFQLSEAAMTHLHLAHYRNQLLHLFVKDAMLALCLTPTIDYGNLLHLLIQFKLFFLYSKFAGKILCSAVCSGFRVYLVTECIC